MEMISTQGLRFLIGDPNKIEAGQRDKPGTRTFFCIFLFNSSVIYFDKKVPFT